MDRSSVSVPYHRLQIGDAEIAEVVEVLRSGWLTTGPRVARFEEAFRDAVGARHAVAVSSCTAALHLAVDALGLRPGEAVLLPSMTFAATAEVIRYQGAFPVLVDCIADTQQLDLDDAARKVEMLKRGSLPVPRDAKVVGIIPVHVGGAMLDMDAVRSFAAALNLWVVEDAAHAFLTARRRGDEWIRCGQGTAHATCFSFYANKAITTGEGGMIVTDDEALAQRMRVRSNHGLSRSAWARYSGGSDGAYQVIEPGFKYNLTDIAAALGIHQLARADEMRAARESVARAYLDAFRDDDHLELPGADDTLRHAWHLFPIRLRLDRIGGDRNAALVALKAAGVSGSVHWRPLHAHEYYQHLGWSAAHCPVADAVWPRLLSLPIYPGLTTDEITLVIEAVRNLRRPE